MVNYNIKRFCWVFGVLLIVSFIFIRLLLGHIGDYSVSHLWSDLSSSISITAIFAFTFERWLWKLPIFQGWLVPFPSLAGEWQGTINYNWNNTDNSKDINLTIRQTFLRIQIIIETDESMSRSICGSFDIERMRGRQHLIYSYLNEPKAMVRDRSQIHYGTAMLEFNDKGNSMTGTYWTDRKSVGDMNLKKVSQQ